MLVSHIAFGESSQSLSCFAIPEDPETWAQLQIPKTFWIVDVKIKKVFLTALESMNLVNFVTFTDAMHNKHYCQRCYRMISLT